MCCLLFYLWLPKGPCHGISLLWSFHSASWAYELRMGNRRVMYCRLGRCVLSTCTNLPRCLNHFRGSGTTVVSRSCLGDGDSITRSVPDRTLQCGPLATSAYSGINYPNGPNGLFPWRRCLISSASLSLGAQNGVCRQIRCIVHFRVGKMRRRLFT